jgi:hypothetical protein
MNEKQEQEIKEQLQKLESNKPPTTSTDKPPLNTALPDFNQIKP